MRWALAAGAVAVSWQAVAGAKGHGWLGWPGAYAVVGLAGCWLIVVVSKGLGRAGIQRPEGEDG